MIARAAARRPANREPKPASVVLHCGAELAARERKVLLSAANAATPRGRRWSLVVVGDRRMRRLNREFHAVDETTDVLAFELERWSTDGFDGEVIVCAPYARREARSRGLAFTTELALYAVHGILHLLGEDDHEPERARRMRRRERQILARVRIELPPHHLDELKYPEPRP
ncbi:MAG: rRNA maturation RNase YbeY [Planctomycetes bacterium]|nr:rRNA maturation RNase YbeY [Planctomycetota bacterium]MCC7172778.1 rRNA maturation RNase YbeY [Planctomycetota bacterium]